MTDKEFDNLTREALTSTQVPPELNKSLLDKLQKKKQPKIVSFVRPASAIAAVFICAVAILNVYNSDTYKHKSNPPEVKADTTAKTVAEDKKDSAEETTLSLPLSQTPDSEEKAVAEPENKTAPIKTKETGHIEAAPLPAQEIAEEVTEQSEVAAKEYAETDIVLTNEAPLEITTSNSEEAPAEEDFLPEVASPATAAVETEAMPLNEVTSDEIISEANEEDVSLQAFSKARIAEPTLSSLFNEGYDFKTIIEEKIRTQISEFENAEEYTFTEISGSEKFTISEENVLTIVFSEGEIISAEHGEQFFTIGTVEDGVIK